MKNIKKTTVRLARYLFLIFIFCLSLLSVGSAQAACMADRWNSTLTTLLSSHATIQAAVDAAATANVIKVSGTCNENVLVREEKARITLDGQGSAAIAGPAGTIATLRIRGNLVTVTGFLSISGGEDGILVDRGGTAVIINNTIQSTGRNGIVVNESATARIGFSTGNDIVARPNTIQSNPNRGIVVTRHSTARIVGNTIINNGDDGVGVFRVSQADIAGNTINGNGGDGVSVSQNSGVNLGNDTGTTIFDQPNSTNANNTGFGVKCSINSYVSGPQGTLNGNSGLMQLGGSCPTRSFTDIPMGGNTSGNVADNGGWTIGVSELSNPIGVRLSISGAGTRAAQIDMCPDGGAETVLLDVAGETADVTCVNTPPALTNASSRVTAVVASPNIELRDPPSGPGTFVSLPQGQTVTIGSPVVPDPSNTVPIGVELVDANEITFAFFGLLNDQSVNVQPDPSGRSDVTVLSPGTAGSIVVALVDTTDATIASLALGANVAVAMQPGASDTSNVTVLSGSVTMQLAGQTATATLDAGDSVNVQSDPVTGTASIDVATGSVSVAVGGQTVNVGAGQDFDLVPVAIDVRPGSFPNVIRLGSEGRLPVAILSNATFDARTVNPSSITLAGARVERRGRQRSLASFADVNGDGLADLLVHIEIEHLQLSPSATEATLVGTTFDGKTVTGTDPVTVISRPEHRESRDDRECREEDSEEECGRRQ